MWFDKGNKRFLEKVKFFYFWKIMLRSYQVSSEPYHIAYFTKRWGSNWTPANLQMLRKSNPWSKPSHRAHRSHSRKHVTNFLNMTFKIKKLFPSRFNKSSKLNRYHHHRHCTCVKRWERLNARRCLLNRLDIYLGVTLQVERVQSPGLYSCAISRPTTNKRLKFIMCR